MFQKLKNQSVVTVYIYVRIHFKMVHSKNKTRQVTVNLVSPISNGADGELKTPLDVRTKGRISSLATTDSTFPLSGSTSHHNKLQFTKQLVLINGCVVGNSIILLALDIIAVLGDSIQSAEFIRFINVSRPLLRSFFSFIQTLIPFISVHYNRQIRREIYELWQKINIFKVK